MNVVPRRPLSRRTILRGVGAAIGLPWLEAMTAPAGQAAPVKQPVRMAMLYVGNGVRVEDWDLPDTGPLPEKLSPILEPLEALRGDVSVIGGLSNRASTARDLAAHTRPQASFLTGVCPTTGVRSEARLGVSADQVAASRIGDRTRLPTLAMATSQGAGEYGYGDWYHNLSWRNAVTPVQAMTQPREVFQQLFVPAGAGRGAADDRRSILDFVTAEAKALRPQVSAADWRKLDEYLTSIRTIEERIDRAGRWAVPEKPAGATVPQLLNSRENWTEIVQLLGDLLVLAFQTDSTRICTFMLMNERDHYTKFPEVGVADHHGLSHAGKPKEGEDGYSRVNRHHVAQFAALIEKLKAVKEGDGCLLDSCMIAYGSGLKNGSSHSVDDLPIVLAGRGGGLNPGRHIRFRGDPPLCNLWVSLLDRMGVPVDQLGDSTGRLEGL